MSNATKVKLSIIVGGIGGFVLALLDGKPLPVAALAGVLGAVVVGAMLLALYKRP